MIMVYWSFKTNMLNIKSSRGSSECSPHIKAEVLRKCTVWILDIIVKNDGKSHKSFELYLNSAYNNPVICTSFLFEDDDSS